MNKKAIIAAIVAVIAVPVAVYAVGPFFTNTTIDEPLPTSALSVKDQTTDIAMPDKKMEDTMTDKAMLETMEKDEPMEKTGVMVKDEVMAEEQETEISEEIVGTQSTAEDYAVPLSGTFVGIGDGIHDAQGNALVIPLGGGQSILRLEEFRSTNGPDLYVYLATDKDASEFVNLGRLKANIGNQNYEIPQGTDMTKYGTVLIWCKQFSVLFGSAQLS